MLVVATLSPNCIYLFFISLLVRVRAAAAINYATNDLVYYLAYHPPPPPPPPHTHTHTHLCIHVNHRNKTFNDYVSVGDKMKLQKIVQMAWTFVNDR